VTTPEKALPEPFPSDVPVVQDGGRIKLAGDIRTRVGWPTGEVSYGIIVELIEPGWVEFHIGEWVKGKVARARRWAAAGKAPRSTYNLQAVDDVFQEVTFDPKDGRFPIPGPVLAYLGVHPKESDGEPEPGNGGLRGAGKKKGKANSRYGGQQLFVQASERSVTVMSLERRRRRVEQVLEDLPTDNDEPA